MRLAPEIGIRMVDVADDGTPTSILTIEHAPFGPRVAGAVLEAAVACAPGYLVFLTNDIPSEDTLSIHLLARDGALLDTASLGHIYTTGAFSALRLRDPDAVSFRFMGETDWFLQLLPARSWRLPFIADAPGVHRRFGFSRRFRVRGTPQGHGR